MNRLKKYIRDILNNALLAGELKDSDKLINTIPFNNNASHTLSDTETENIIKKLQEHQKEVKTRRQKLKNINLIRSLGEYVQLWQEENEVIDQEMAQKLGVNFDELNIIKRNLQSFISIDIERMIKALKFFKFKFGEARALIEKTYFLSNIQLSSKNALSRYDIKKPSNHGKSMRSAVEELLSKANQKKSFTDGKQEELQSYLRKLEKYWEK
ncbi:MAG: hypothetical protein GF383_00385 [Candidatus Lokiarchaeota archaeon]|nr:hypothetical protein [Candidatus Lokiarchaeota archaeon]